MGEERFFQLPVVIAARADLSPAAKLVYAALASYARMKDGAYPAQATIGKAIAFGERHVRNGLKELETVGLLESQRRGAFQSNSYKLQISETNPARNNSSCGNDSSSGHSSSDNGGNSSSAHGGRRVPTNRCEELSNKASAADATPMVHLERLDWLARTLLSFSPDLGKPDAAILKRIEEAANGAPEDAIEVALHRLYDSGLHERMRSWALMVKVLPEEIGKLS